MIRHARSRVMQERTALEDQLAAIARIEQEVSDQVTMIELGEMENDQTVVADAEAAIQRLREESRKRELESLLSGEADANDCYLEVNAGAGGTERRIGPRCCCACILAGPSSMAIRWNGWKRARANRPG